jgi:putative nucleotidyltransferase with HDIG domain
MNPENYSIENDREICCQLLYEYTLTDSLRKHAHAVESCVMEYALKFGEPENYWANVALLHDFDYEKFPTEQEHPYKGAEILREKGFCEDFVLSVLSHTNYTGIPRDTLLRKTLFACDELASFILAVVYVRPSKAIDDVAVQSVKKKLKDKAFARAVSREDIISGAQGLGVELDEHIAFCLEALKKHREKLGI